MLIDPAIRAAFKLAHRGLRAYWFLRRPTTQGALVALWHKGQLLVVKNSYRAQYTLPGGYLHAGEVPEEAAARELYEEVNFRLPADRLKMVYANTLPYEHRQDSVCICEAELSEKPALRVDNREVIWADFLTPALARARPLVPHLIEYLDQQR